MVRIEMPSREAIAAFCRENRIRRLAFFGSVVREDFRPESDVDVLVEFEPDASIGFFELYDIEQALSALLGGRRVDVCTPAGLSPYVRDAALAEAEVQYVAA